MMLRMKSSLRIVKHVQVLRGGHTASPSILNTISLIQAAHKKEEDINHILRQYYMSTEKSAVDPQPFNIALDILYHSHGTISMLKLFNTMQFQMTNLTPSAYTYNTVMKCCLKEDKWEHALNIWHQMISSGCKPNEFTLNRVLQAMSKGLKWELALETLRTIPARYNFVASEHCFTTAITACGRAGRMSEAIEILNEFEGSQGLGSVYSYSAAIRACREEDQRPAHSAASELFSRFVAQGGKPNQVILGSLLNAYAIGGKWFESLTLLYSQDFKPNIVAYNTVLLACAKEGEVDLCIGLLRDMLVREGAPKPNVVSFTTAISACAHRGQCSEVTYLLSEMEDQGVTPSGFTYTTAANVMVKGGKWEEALKLLDMVTNESQNEMKFAVAMRAWASSGYEGSDDIILKLFSKLTGISTSKDVTSEEHSPSKLVYADLHCYQLALEACARLGHLDTSFSIIDSMLSNGPFPDTRCFNSCIEAFTKSASRSHAFDEYGVRDILPMLDQMALHGVNPNTVTINVMMRALCLVGGIRQALRLYREHFEVSGTTEIKLKPDLLSFTTLFWGIALQTISGAAIHTRHLLKQAMEVEVEPDELFIIAALNALVRTEQHSEALYLFRSVLIHKKLYVSRAFAMIKCEDPMDAEVLDQLVTRSKWSNILSNVKFWNTSMEALSSSSDAGFLSLRLLSSMKQVCECNEETISLCVQLCCEQALEEGTTHAMRDKLLREAIALTHNFLNSPQCEDVHIIGRAMLTLKRAVGMCSHQLTSEFKKEVEAFYFNHNSHKSNKFIQKAECVT